MGIIFSTKCTTRDEEILSTLRCIKIYVWNYHYRINYKEKLEEQKNTLCKLIEKIK
jgi:hypothetical protein